MPDTLPTPESDTSPNTTASPTSTAPDQVEPAAQAATDPPAIGDTAGTGTIIALGCIGATVFLIVIGLLYLLITQLFG